MQPSTHGLLLLHPEKKKNYFKKHIRLIRWYFSYIWLISKGTSCTNKHTEVFKTIYINIFPYYATCFSSALLKRTIFLIFPSPNIHVVRNVLSITTAIYLSVKWTKVKHLYYILEFIKHIFVFFQFWQLLCLGRLFLSAKNEAQVRDSSLSFLFTSISNSLAGYYFTSSLCVARIRWSF